MKVEDFKSPLGSLIPISGTDARLREYDHFAFQPDPLPDRVELTSATWTAVVRAGEALGRLNQACSNLPYPRLLVTPALYREARTTSELEGTHATTEQILQATLPFDATTTPETAEIVAYVEIADDAFGLIRERPLSLGLLCSAQEKLAKHSVKTSLDPGKVREHRVVIGPDECRVEDARFVPPLPGAQLEADLRDWLTWVEQPPSDIHPIVAAAMAHYQFETLHPFGDGNGRIGRLSVLLQLLRSGVLDEPSFSISSWLLPRRSTYQDMLLRVSQIGDWDSWVGFFATAVAEQARTAADVGRGLVEWRSHLLAELNQRKYSGTIVSLANDLIEWPYISTKGVSLRYDVSQPAAQKAIDRLEELGYVTERTGRSYARRWGADFVMNSVETL